MAYIITHHIDQTDCNRVSELIFSIQSDQFLYTLNHFVIQLSIKHLAIIQIQAVRIVQFVILCFPLFDRTV